MNRQVILYTSLILALGCTPKDEALDAGLPVAQDSVATAATCANFLKGKTQMNLKQILVCAPLICATYPMACQPTPGPGPLPGVGGSVSTGGTSSRGGGAATGGKATTGGTSGVQSQEQLACANELRLGCPEGSATNCAGIMATRCANPKVKCNTACIVNATSKATLQTKCLVACGAL